MKRSLCSYEVTCGRSSVIGIQGREEAKERGVEIYASWGGWREKERFNSERKDHGTSRIFWNMV